MKTRLLIFGVTCLVLGAIFGILAIYSLQEIQNNLEYFKTLPLGSSQPGIDYGTLWQNSVVGIVLFISGGILLIRNKIKRQES